LVLLLCQVSSLVIELTFLFSSIFTRFKNTGTKLTIGLTAPVGLLTQKIISTGNEFEAQMSKVQAISGATGDELEKLTNKAKEMGASTKFTASEAADAFNYMAMAGWKTEDMLGRYRWNIKSSGSIWSRFSSNIRYCNRCINSNGL